MYYYYYYYLFIYFSYFANAGVDREMRYKNTNEKRYTKSKLIKSTIIDTNNTTYKVSDMNY